ncbi:hypothetical protein DV735_g4621, partial [Chaetothyriales sp. CBS 134920]
MSDLYTPFIADDSFEPSVFAGDQFGVQFHEGLLAKPGPFLSMSAYEKAAQRDMLECSNEPHGYLGYGNGSFNPQIYYDQGLSGANGPDPEFDYVSDDALSTPGQKKVPLMATQGRQLSNGGLSESSYKPDLAQKNDRKRKSYSPEYDAAPPSKKAACSQLSVDGSCYDVSGQTSPYSSFLPTPNSSASFNPSPVVVTSKRPMGHHYSTSTASQASLAAPSVHTPPTWSPSFATVKTEPSPPAPATPAPRPATASPLASTAPKLVRTSTIQQPSPSANGTYNTVHTASFNPYAMLPLKADLKLKGDLDSMTRNWTDKEIDARRRLVEFKRSQQASTITAEFKPVAPEDRAPSSITISCILWKEKKEYYVTSVDTIYLLEALVGVRFTVEEKNRIRRNLEGFRPATVSKSKPDSEEFFKVIMGFPHPKPRNIEKDVKVFPWKILSVALKKIISKYSASYSSTASALPATVPSSFAPEQPAEFGYELSPHTVYRGPVPSYPAAHAVAYQAQMSAQVAPVTTAPIPELHLQLPTSGPGYEVHDPYGFAPMAGMPQVSAMMNPEAMPAPVQRMPASWQFQGYSSEPAHPNSAPPMPYHRGPVETPDFGPPVTYHVR